MEQHTVAVDNESVARNRFESFKLGKGLPSTMALKHTHTRSHSRNTSISSLSFSTSPKSTTLNDMSSFSFPAACAPTLPTSAAPTPTSKRNSHHRRRSSVSTRRESAEMMGVSVPDLPPSEDNVYFGDKDSIRRRALWALEGKPDSYSKVEIPDISTPGIEKKMFDFPTKPSFPPGPGPGYSSGSLMTNKRDSFKLLASSASSKDQLHTLVEEEEEDSEDSPVPVEESAFAAPTVALVKSVSSRPRPLSLRPLSLTPENLLSTTSGLPTPSLTPSPRTGLKSLALAPPPVEELKPPTSATNRRQSLIFTTSPTPRRPSLHLNINTSESISQLPSVDESKPSRRSSIGYISSSSSNGVGTSLVGLPTPDLTPTSFDRRSSIASARSSRNSSSEDDFFPALPAQQSRPLSTSEQHFLFKSHNALLARITDLERALSMRRRTSGGASMSTNSGGYSRPVSVASDGSSSYGGGSEMGSGNELSDEMLRLVADLKAERDELKRDVDGWRTRVGDMEKQLGVLARRVDGERRDAWVARSRVGLLEVEKGALEKKFEAMEMVMADLEEKKIAWGGEKANLERENEELRKRNTELYSELEVVKAELERERVLRKEKDEAEGDPLATPTPRSFEARPRAVGGYPRHRGLGFTSLDSESSVTDVESLDDTLGRKFGFPLNVVQEESERTDDEGEMSEEENALAGYEDEEDSDLSFQSPIGSSSSFGSAAELPGTVAHLRLDVPGPPTPAYIGSGSGTPTVRSRSSSPVLAPGSNIFAAPSALASRPTHSSRASLSKTWTFPRNASTPLVDSERASDVDRFFGCLEDLDAEGSDSSTPGSPSAYEYEKSKGLFASGFKYGGGDDDGLFFIPGGVGFEISEPTFGLDETGAGLEAVMEEDEDEDETTDVEERGEEDMFGEVGGIRITFTPPELDSPELTSERSSSPVKRDIPLGFFADGDDDEAAVPFNFGRSTSQPHGTDFSTPPNHGMITPPSSVPRINSPRAPSPSSIPRAKIVFKPASTAAEVVSTPPRPTFTRYVSPTSYAANTFVTPPTKRGGTTPSFIPQPISSPSPMRNITTPTKQKAASTFIRHPPRKPLMSTNSRNQNSSGAAYVHPGMNPRSLRRSSAASTSPTDASAHTPRSYHGSTSEMKSIDLSDHRAIATTTPKQRDYSSSSSAAFTPSSLSSIMSSPLAARLSFQTLTNFIPLSWAPRVTPVESAAASAAASLCLGPVSSSSSSTSGSFSETRANGDVAVIQPRVSLEIANITPFQRRGYVSKEKQLRKLRARLESEGAAQMIGTSVIDVCKKCTDDAVFL